MMGRIAMFARRKVDPPEFAELRILDAVHGARKNAILLAGSRTAVVSCIEALDAQGQAFVVGGEVLAVGTPGRIEID